MKNIKEIRIQCKMSMKELGDAVGVSESMICLIEAGKRLPTVRIAKRIADVLKFDWTEFFADIH